MSQESTPGASEGNPAGSGEPTSGSSSDGGAGTQSAADAFVAERESLTKQARDFQSARDRERARAEAAERELAALKAGNSPEPASAPPAFTMEDFLRIRELDRAASALQAEYPEADEGMFARSHEYDSPEAFRAAVERSHNARKSYKDKIEREAQEKAREILRQHGVQIEDPAPPTSGDTPTSGDPTPAELTATPVSEWEDRGWTDEVVDRVLAANNSGGLYRMNSDEE